VNILIDKESDYCFSVGVISQDGRDIVWPTKVNKDEVLIDLRSLAGWAKKRDDIIGPYNFQNLVRRTIQNFCCLAAEIDTLLCPLDEFAGSQKLRDFAGYLFTLDKSFLLLSSLQTQFYAGTTHKSINLGP